MNWVLIDDMVSQLGDLYAIEVEVSSFPEISQDPAVQEVRLALLRATDAMSRIASGSTGPAIEAARDVLTTAAASAAMARRVLADARAARNRRA